MIPVRWVRLACVVFVASGLARVSAAGASAMEELSRRMPDDVIAFVGTSGGDVLKEDFQKTIVGRIWNDPAVRSFYRSIKTELVAKAGQESGDPNLAQKIDMVLGYVRLAVSRPVVIGAIQVPLRDGPPVGGFAILDAGDRKTEFAAIVSKLEAMVGRDNIIDKEIGSLKLRALENTYAVPPYWGWAGNHFVIAVNDPRGAVVKYLSRPRLVSHPSLGKVPGSGDALVVTADIQKVRQLTESIIREESGQKDVDTFKSVLKSLGLAEVKTFCARAGFAGPDVTVQAVLEVPTPATGLFASIRSVDPASFGVVDVRAVTANTAHCDLTALYDTVMGVIKAVSPDEAYPVAQKAITSFESGAGLRIREGLLASLAGPAVSYSMPLGATIELPKGGTVVVAKLKDAPLFEKTMAALGALAQSKANGMIQIGEQARDDGRVVHMWTFPPVAMAGIMPTWSAVNEHVVIGSNMEVHDLALQHLGPHDASAKSILDAEGYRKATAGLPKSLASLTYIDSQVHFRQIWMQAQQVWPMLTMVATQGGVKLPVAVPVLTQIARDMKPSLRYSYWGSDGLHWVYRGPGVEVGQMNVGSAALGMGILMPALARVRQLSFRMTSGTNLSLIGKACLIYAPDHGGKLPPDLQTLVTEADLSAKCLESKLKPEDFDGPSYIYIPGQDRSMHPGNVLAYDNPEFCVEGVNVLFLDTHVEFMKPQAFRKAMEATYTRLKRSLPRIRFRNDEPDDDGMQSTGGDVADARGAKPLALHGAF